MAVASAPAAAAATAADGAPAAPLLSLEGQDGPPSFTTDQRDVIMKEGDYL